MRIITVGIFVSLLAYTQLLSAKQVPIEVFSAGVQYTQVKLSPDGNYLSFTSKVEGRNSLVVLKLDNNKIENVVRFSGNAEVGNYAWVNNNRLVLQKLYLRGWTDHPEYHGELFGIDADGSNGKYLVGYQGEMQTGSRIKKATPVKGSSYILDPLVDEERYMLVYTIPWNAGKNAKTVVYKVDVNRGTRRKVASSPSAMARFLTDNQGKVRVSLSTDDHIDQTIHIRDKEDGEWQEFDVLENLTDIKLHTFDRSGKKVYITASQAGEADSVFELTLDTGKTEKLLQDKIASPKKLWVDETNHELFAVELEPGYPTYAFIDNDAEMTKRLKSLINALPGEQIQLLSTTQDGSKSVVFASSDINPGSYYLYDDSEKKLQFLFSAMEGIDRKYMAATKPISFKARDGLTIHGYLTLPENQEAKNLPLVVMPHGGPHGPRDWWGFDPDAQLLANRGMAVLKVNFRGSGGYGRSFEHAGHKKWGAEIQYDIIDATKYVVAQGFADPNNICIMGASFGGYSALQSSIIEPDLFKCAIGVVGVYDLPLMFKEGDIAGRERGQRYLKQVLGEDQQQLKAYSPVFNIDKLKAPVLVVHGGDDQRAPIEQAESLISSLKQANHPYEYMLLENEGHGFYKPKHRTEYYKRVLAFLQQHLTL